MAAPAAEEREFWEGSLVEVSGTGQRGQCVAWDEAHEEFVVRTFDGALVRVEASSLSGHEPPAPDEDGGFDLAWPEGFAAEAVFPERVAGCLSQRGYCVVRTFLSPEAQAKAREEALSRSSEHEPFHAELGPFWLGAGDAGGVLRLAESGGHGGEERQALGADRGALEVADGFLNSLSRSLAAVTLECLDFESFGRTPTLVRSFPDGVGASVRRPKSLTKEDITQGVVEEFIHFVRCRRLCMLHVVDGEGCEVELVPANGGGLQRATVRLRANSFLVFRHDAMDYALRQRGSSLIMQAWILSEPLAVELLSFDGPASRAEDAMGLTGPQRPACPGRACYVASLMERMPGSVYGADQAWAMFSAGGDTAVRWPKSRWPEEPYYSDDPHAAAFGKTYSVHGAFMDFSEVTIFDHAFFGIGLEEATWMAVEQRLVLETGCETLIKGGYSKKHMRGHRIGVFVGDVGSEDLMSPPYTEFTHDGLQGGVCAARLAHVLDLRGPAVSHDTACSSSLMALGFAHWKMRADEGDSLPASLVMGINLHMTVIRYIGLGSGGFLTKKGRCFTFDTSAEGYLRGEGCGGVLLKLAGHEETDRDSRYAECIGTGLNQDGRSASLTAPNGPSQQAVIKQSMRMAQITPDMVGAAECHGTGTALGDPIELGALMGVLGAQRKNAPPLAFTTSKINLGHTEAHAGMAGLAKCILCCTNGYSPPHNHLVSLSPHLHLDGFPAFVPTDATDSGRTSDVIGVSSFGFGGSNGRADFWGRSTNRASGFTEKVDYVEVSCPRCLGPMCWLCGVAIPHDAPAEKHHCSLVREHFAGYDYCSTCYRGRYAFGDMLHGPKQRDHRVYIIGTWSGWATPQEMRRQSDGSFVCDVRLGDTRWERFYLFLDGDKKCAFYPAGNKSDPSVRVLGPDDRRAARHWLIDGRGDGHSAGACYRVRFTLGDAPEISWEVVNAPSPAQGGNVVAKRGYFVSGSWAAWNLQAMAATRQDGVYEARFKVGARGYEEFQILRDKDVGQTLHPATAKASASSVPLRGPDGYGHGKHWLVQGAELEEVKLRLHVSDDLIAVSLTSRSLGRRTFQGRPGAYAYYVAGSFTGGEFAEMRPAAEDGYGVYVYVLAVGDSGVEDFRIAVDQDWDQCLYPSVTGAGSGEALLQGPGPAPRERPAWRIVAAPGEELEILLDLAQGDRRRVVRWRRPGEALPASSQLEFLGGGGRCHSAASQAQQPVALLFPGQGSQYVGMLADLADDPEVVGLAAIARSVLGFDLLELCRKGPEATLEETKFCQPAMFLADIAGLVKLRRSRPDAADRRAAVAGLSLGEYAALCAAGVFDFADGMELVRIRGEAMSEAAKLRPQAMLSVAGLDEEVLQRMCDDQVVGGEVCQFANLLFPQGVACSGTQSAIAALKRAAEDAGAASARLLKTSGAFHTALMEPARLALGAALRRLAPRMRPPVCDVYMNLTGAKVRAGTPPSELIPLLEKQLVSPVLWSASMQAMLRDGIQEFYEVGPAKQLRAMMRRIDAEAWQATTSLEI